MTNDRLKTGLLGHASLVRAVASGCLALALGSMLAGCGAEKQTVAPLPPAGATPAGDNPDEYRKMMESKGRPGGAPGGGGPGGSMGGSMGGSANGPGGSTNR